MSAGRSEAALPLDSLFHPYLGAIMELEKQQEPCLVGWGWRDARRLSKVCQ